MKKKLKLVGVVKQSLVAWMQKNIQVKLIHLLGGVSKEEAIKINNDSFHQGDMYGRAVIKRYFIELEKRIYGKSKQDWINIIHSAIKYL